MTNTPAEKDDWQQTWEDATNSCHYAVEMHIGNVAINRSFVTNTFYNLALASQGKTSPQAGLVSLQQAEFSGSTALLTATFNNGTDARNFRDRLEKSQKEELSKYSTTIVEEKRPVRAPR